MNEIKLINVGGIDQNIKDQYVRDIIAPSENGLDSSTNLPVSSRHYDEGDYLIAQDRKYYEAITDIDIGDPLVVGTNIRETTVTDEIIMLKGQSANVAIETIADMETAATASKAFATGKYVYWNYGVDYGMYEVIADIAEGDAFVTTGVNKNIELANKIGDDVSLLKKTTTNPNLLDNPWFTVNQRGQSSYTDNGYSVDRWMIYNGSLSVSNEIMFTKTGGDVSNIYQYIENTSLYNKYLTLSAIIDGVLYKASGLVPSGKTGSWQIITSNQVTSEISIRALVPPTNVNGDIRIEISFNDLTAHTLRALKLELGSRSTLANDTAPNYQHELAKCQRYFVRFGAGSTFLGFVNNTTTIYGTITTPVKMRINNPSVITSGTILMNWAGHAGSGGEAINTLTIYSSNSNMLSFGASIPTGSLTAGQCAEISARTDAYIDLTADL